ncbi:MAG: class I adenylate-forming enzyme family protein [Steroidobacteraceae bacterium]
MTGNFRPLLIADGVHASARRTPDKIALECAGRFRSFAALAQRVRVIAAKLASDHGVRRGERVAIFAPNCLEYPEIVCGCADAGAIIATVNPRGNANELRAACDDCGARVLFVHESLLDMAGKANCATVERQIVIGGDYENWSTGSADTVQRPVLEETDPFTLVYSSGTTGAPKGILISHRSRVLTFHGMAMEYGCYGPDDRFLALAPMAHGAGFAFAMGALYFGAYVRIVPRFDPEQLLRELAEGCFTGVFLVPTHFQSIFALPKATLDRYRGTARNLRAIISNAAPLPQAVKQSIVEYFGEGLLHESYGSTEAGIVTNLRPQYQLARRQSVGKPFAATFVRILDEQGADMGSDETGELYSTSPYLFNGYWNQPQATAAAMRGNWLTAGDLARRDADGFIYIVDRKKDMVISGGINIYPREIEEVLLRCDGILEAAVVGTPDPHWGERLVAFVVRYPTARVDEATLAGFCATELSRYKLPREFRFIDALPRNAGGKILKNELRALLA